MNPRDQRAEPNLSVVTRFLDECVAQEELLHDGFGEKQNFPP